MTVLDNDLKSARRYNDFERHTTIAGVIVGAALLATAAIPVSTDPTVFLWELPQTPGAWVSVAAHWIAGGAILIAALVLRGAVRGVVYILCGAVVMAAAGTAAMVTPTIGTESPPWVRGALAVGLCGACVLLWTEHIRLHVRPAWWLRVCEALSGAGVLGGFAALTVALGMLLASAPREMAFSVGGQRVGTNPRALLLCGLIVVSFLALGGLAGLIASVIPYRGRRQSLGVLTPIYFAMTVLAAMMILLGGRILGIDGVVRGLHVTVLVLMKPLGIAYGLAAVAAARAAQEIRN